MNTRAIIRGWKKSLIENGAGIERFWLHFLEKEIAAPKDKSS